MYLFVMTKNTVICKVKDIAKLFYVRVTVGGWEDPSQRILHLFIQINTFLENVVFRPFLFPVMWLFRCGPRQLHYSFRGPVAFFNGRLKNRLYCVFKTTYKPSLKGRGTISIGCLFTTRRCCAEINTRSARRDNWGTGISSAPSSTYRRKKSSI